MNEDIYSNWEDLTPYMKFMLDNRGYYFVNKKGEGVDKWEIWNTFEHHPDLLKSIYQGTHSLYKRKKK